MLIALGLYERLAKCRMSDVFTTTAFVIDAVILLKAAKLLLERWVR